MVFHFESVLFRIYVDKEGGRERSVPGSGGGGVVLLRKPQRR